MEFFIDQDPGFGKAHPNLIASSDTVSTGFLADTTGLTPTQHWMVVRATDTSGNWSIIQKASFSYRSTPRTWTGLVDDNWNNAGNWSQAGVPGWNDDVMIPAQAPYRPVVRCQGLSCRNVVGTPGGGELHINSGFVLTVNGSVRLD